LATSAPLLLSSI